jgi:hypothetical protein
MSAVGWGQSGDRPAPAHYLGAELAVFRPSTGTWYIRVETCDSAYPGVCIPPPPPDLDCADVPYRNFRIVAPDPHGFDADGDGVGCET